LETQKQPEVQWVSKFDEIQGTKNRDQFSKKYYRNGIITNGSTNRKISSGGEMVRFKRL